MRLPQVYSEFDRIWACGRSVWHTTLGLRGSDTSTAVKFFGALSCASQMMRRPSGAICTDMPSPMPPKPSSMWWESSLKFQVTTPLVPDGPALRTAGLLTFAGRAALRLAVFFAADRDAFLADFFLVLDPNAFFTERKILLARFINLAPA